MSRTKAVAVLSVLAILSAGCGMQNSSGDAAGGTTGKGDQMISLKSEDASEWSRQ